MKLEDEVRWGQQFLEVFDKDGDGTLTLGEYLELLRFFVVFKAATESGVNLDEVCAEGEFKVMLARKELDNTIETCKVFKLTRLKELEAGATKEVLKEVAASARQAYTELDRNKNNSLNGSELRAVLVTLMRADPWVVTDAHIQSLVSIFDSNRNGELSFDEFHALWRLVVLLGMESQGAAEAKE